MSQTILSRQPEWIRHFNTLDSTNNYAMQLIDDGMAQSGLVVWADRQTGGKGQRGNTWKDDVENLKFSLLVTPHPPVFRPFHLSMLVAVTLVKYLKIILPENCIVAVKWPNDIYINDKKACGILIENVFRGVEWVFAVIGIGLNVNLEKFPEHLQMATSLCKEAAGKKFDFMEIITDLRNGILNEIQASGYDFADALLEKYNQVLYQKDRSVNFRERSSGHCFEAFVSEVEMNGQLVLLLPSGIRKFEFGSLEWLL